MAKIISQVYETLDYDSFSMIEGNRVINPIHVRRLRESFKGGYLFSPIAVNEKMQIIDGQNRFLAAMELGLPICFYVCEGYGLPHVQVLNSNASNWGKMDFLKSYSDLGLPEYLKMTEFMKQYPDFGIKVCEMLLTGNTGGANNRAQFSVNGKSGRIRNFEEGLFEVKDMDMAIKNAEKIMMVKPYFAHFNSYTFACAMVQIFKNENYLHGEFINKLRQQPSALTPCGKAIQYRELIEEIYNYKRRADDRLNLRF